MSAPPIILASGSIARQKMLTKAGITFEIIPANIDESTIQDDPSLSPENKALKLAEAKALAVSANHEGALIIGSDQILDCEGTVFSKAETPEQAAEKLRDLRGKTHRLISGVAIVKDGEILWRDMGGADLTMHDFDDAFLADYMDAAGDALTSCVGSYALEEYGSWLFSDIKGDVFTILGMPLMPLLKYLNNEHGIKP